MTKKRKIIIAISSTIVVAGVAYIIARRQRNKKRINQIHAILDNRSGQYGSIKDFSDLFSGAAFVNTAKSKKSNIILLRDEYVTLNRKRLNAAIKGAGTDEDAIKDVFRALKDKVQMAQVAESYRKNYNINLLEDMLGDMDEDSADMNDIRDIIMSKPNYRVTK
jgi:hypothetical protein